MIILQNLLSEGGSYNRPNEAVRKILKSKTGETIFEVGKSTSTIMFDYGGETYGFNRLKGESFNEYVNRVLEKDNLNWPDSDFALTSMVPEGVAELNSKIKTFDHTYYFSIASGY